MGCKKNWDIIDYDFLATQAVGWIIKEFALQILKYKILPITSVVNISPQWVWIPGWLDVGIGCVDGGRANTIMIEANDAKCKHF